MKTEPMIWLNDYEQEGAADCGCELLRDYEDGGPAFAMCAKHEAAPDLLAALHAADKWIDNAQLEFGIENNGILRRIRTAIAKAEAT